MPTVTSAPGIPVAATHVSTTCSENSQDSVLLDFGTTDTYETISWAHTTLERLNKSRKQACSSYSQFYDRFKA